MKNRSARTRAGLALGVALVAAAVLAATLAQGAGAKPGPAVVVKTAAHSCLVMTGSGDPAFVRNFNPYTATTLPSGGFVKGAFYEPLVIATAAGGGHLYPWLAHQLEVVQRRQDAHARDQAGREVVGRQAADRRPTSSTASRPASRTRSPTLIGLDREGTNIASVQQKGRYGVVINLKTPDSQFIAANLNLQMVVPAAHLLEGAGPGDLDEPEPRRVGPVHEDHAVHHAGLRAQQEPELLAGRLAEDPLPRVRAGDLERRGAPA